MKEVVKGVYPISLAWSNVYLLKDGDRAALLDTGLQKDRPDLRRALQEVGVAEEQIEAVYLTHAHCDHAGNAAYFARQRARLYSHRDEAPYMEPPRRSYAPTGLNALQRLPSALLFTAGEWLYPVERRHVHTRLAEGDVVDAPGGPLRVIASPGHTPGHISFFREKDGVLFSGDAILNLIPILRTNTLSLTLRVLSTDWEQVKQSARHLTTLRPDVLLSGHGWPLLKNTAQKLEDWAQTIL